MCASHERVRVSSTIGHINLFYFFPRYLYLKCYLITQHKLVQTIAVHGIPFM